MRWHRISFNRERPELTFLQKWQRHLFEVLNEFGITVTHQIARFRFDRNQFDIVVELLVNQNWKQDAVIGELHQVTQIYLS